MEHASLSYPGGLEKWDAFMVRVLTKLASATINSVLFILPLFSELQVLSGSGKEMQSVIQRKHMYCSWSINVVMIVPKWSVQFIYVPIVIYPIFRLMLLASTVQRLTHVDCKLDNMLVCAKLPELAGCFHSFQGSH